MKKWMHLIVTSVLFALPVVALADDTAKSQPSQVGQQQNEQDNSGTSPAIYGNGNATDSESAENTTSGKQESDSGTVQDDTFGGDPTPFTWVVLGSMVVLMGQAAIRQKAFSAVKLV